MPSPATNKNTLVAESARAWPRTVALRTPGTRDFTFVARRVGGNKNNVKDARAIWTAAQPSDFGAGTVKVKEHYGDLFSLLISLTRFCCASFDAPAQFFDLIRA